MRVGFDISPLRSLHAGRGTGSYTRLLLQGLKTFANDVEVIEVLSEQGIPKDLDLIHFPFFDPFFLTLPFLSERTVVTVHDLIPLAYPEHFPRGIRGELKWLIQRLSLSRASGLITDSNASKRDIVRILRFDENRIRVVYLAPGPEFTPQDTSTIEKVKKKYGLPSEYILYVGDLNWNKNIPGLVAAAGYVSIPLVLAGKAFQNKELPEYKHLMEDITKYDLAGKILMPGFVDQEDLPAVYSGARVYVQPSYAEGFGLPVLEAMACGIPAVVSSKTSLAEIAGPACIVNPDNSKAIGEGIAKVMRGDRKKQSEDGVTRAKQYSWKKTVEQTVNAYKAFLTQT